MHSYQHNIKTFNNATRHLTRVERSLYRDLIELYYDTEQPLNAVDFNSICRKVIANTDEEKECLRYVLSEFFILTGDVYTHNYCDEQIEKYKSAISAKARAGIASAESKKQKIKNRINNRINKKEHDTNKNETEFNTCSTRVTNQEPETSNQEPYINTMQSANANCPYSELIDAYHKALPTLPAVRLLTDARKKALKARWAQTEAIPQSIEAWSRFFEYIGKSDFLMGRTSGNRQFTASFDWIMNSANFVKIVEGNYDNN